MAVYKHNPDDYIWWRSEDFPGSLEFSFDKKTWYEYPYEFRRLTEEQKRLFELDDPDRVMFLRERWG